MIRKRLLLPILAITLGAAACGGNQTAKSPNAGMNVSQFVFESVSPSVVAVLNDDKADVEIERKKALKEMGLEPKAPKTIIDVSLRKEPTPHGTGFMIEGGYIVTSAHVVFSPDRLKITTRAGKVVEAEVYKIDHLRDIAILKPKVPLPEVPPIALDPNPPKMGAKIWAMGHTGGGMWALSWGISEGITSGVVDLLGAKLVLYDASIYPGFSGGPVVMLDDNGKPNVVGVNHAILFTGGMVSTYTIASASITSDIREALAGNPPPIQATLAEFVKAKSDKPRAEIFVTSSAMVHKDPHLMTVAAIFGNQKTIEAKDGIARVPVVAMLFGLGAGKHELEFLLEDPDDLPVKGMKKTITLDAKERVAFASADFSFDPVTLGRYEIVIKEKGKEITRTDVWINDPDDDTQSIDTDDDSDADEGQPKVDVVVAALGKADPLALLGIRAAWSEWRYPRRVDFTWFARGSRGWSGTNVAINAWVLDEKGVIVGRGVGCINREIRPELSWSCMGRGGEPLVSKEGRYDIVFTLNDKPVSTWPMEAILRPDDPNNAFDKWAKDSKKKKPKKGATPPPPPSAPPKAPTPPPATPPKPPTPPAPKK